LAIAVKSIKTLKNSVLTRNTFNITRANKSIMTTVCDIIFEEGTTIKIHGEWVIRVVRINLEA